MLATSAAEGELAPAEADLLSGALGFLRITVGEVMAPRADLVTVPSTATLQQAESLIHDSGHSRVLVTAEHTDEVMGFLHAKDLLRYGDEPPWGALPQGLVRVAQRVRPGETLADVLPKMRHARRHVAVVVEDGELLGLVTLEDLLEAIVGEITDESDKTSDRDK
jgi:CBS domain containing-hemolysin-like protein